MARPIKETPILYGEEARQFEERMKHVRPLSDERIAEIKRDYEYIMSMFEDEDEEYAENNGQAV